VVGVQCGHSRGRKLFAVGKGPLNTEDHAVEMTFLHNAALPDALVIGPGRKRFRQLKHQLKLLACGIFTQREREDSPGERVALVWLIVLKREPLAFPGTKLRPVDSFGALKQLVVQPVGNLGLGIEEGSLSFSHLERDFDC